MLLCEQQNFYISNPLKHHLWKLYVAARKEGTQVGVCVKFLLPLMVYCSSFSGLTPTSEMGIQLFIIKPWDVGCNNSSRILKWQKASFARIMARSIPLEKFSLVQGWWRVPLSLLKQAFQKGRWKCCWVGLVSKTQVENSIPLMSPERRGFGGKNWLLITTMSDI